MGRDKHGLVGHRATSPRDDGATAAQSRGQVAGVVAGTAGRANRHGFASRAERAGNLNRWATIDTLHARTGLVPPELDFTHLKGKVEELKLLIEIHYRHYQFYANMLVAVAIAYLGYRFHVGFARPGLPDLAVVVLEPIFYLTSRDTLRKYYGRSRQLLTP